jgi:hypothetical protein
MIAHHTEEINPLNAEYHRRSLAKPFFYQQAIKNCINDLSSMGICGEEEGRWLRGWAGRRIF